jgi:pimeloyl-ACP methyl ester carboxylesterase
MRSAHFTFRPAVFVCFLLLSLCSFAYSQNIVKTSGFADVGGAKLYYESAGKGHTVVLIHGGLADSRLWDDQFDEFAKHYRVIRYDLRGFGRSDFPSGTFSHVDDLYALLKYLKVEKVSLAGVSLGGIIAADLTLEHPEMVEALILTSSGLRGDKSPRNEKSLAAYKMAETGGKEKAIELWLEHPFFVTGKNHRNYQKRTRQMLSDNYKYWGPTPQTIQLTWGKQPTIERLAEIRVPTLIIVGDKDAPQIISISQTLQANIPNTQKIVIPGVSHHLVMEKPKEYNRIVLKFLKKKTVSHIPGARTARPPLPPAAQQCCD